MDSIILNSYPKKDIPDWERIIASLRENKTVQIDTHLGKNYITRILRSKKIYDCNITREYVGTGKNKRPRGWVLKLK